MLNKANTVEAFLRDQLSGGIQQAIVPFGFTQYLSKLSHGY
jgi:hypothetical protein